MHAKPFHSFTQPQAKVEHRCFQQKPLTQTNTFCSLLSFNMSFFYLKDWNATWGYQFTERSNTFSVFSMILPSPLQQSHVFRSSWYKAVLNSLVWNYSQSGKYLWHLAMLLVGDVSHSIPSRKNTAASFIWVKLRQLYSRCVDVVHSSVVQRKIEVKLTQFLLPSYKKCFGGW